MVLIVQKYAVLNVAKALIVILSMELVITDVKMVTMAQTVSIVRFLFYYTNLYTFNESSATILTI